MYSVKCLKCGLEESIKAPNIEEAREKAETILKKHHEVCGTDRLRMDDMSLGFALKDVTLPQAPA
jgi:hypothetical protein